MDTYEKWGLAVRELGLVEEQIAAFAESELGSLAGCKKACLAYIDVATARSSCHLVRAFPCLRTCPAAKLLTAARQEEYAAWRAHMYPEKIEVGEVDPCEQRKAYETTDDATSASTPPGSVSAQEQNKL